MRKGKGSQPNDKSNSKLSAKLSEVSMKLSSNQDLNLPLPEEIKHEKKKDTSVKTAPVTPTIENICAVYSSSSSALNQAVITQSMTNPIFGIKPAMWSKTGKREMHFLYLDKLQETIEAGNTYNEVLRVYRTIRNDIFAPQKLSEITGGIEQINQALTLAQQSGKDFPEEVWPDLAFINQYICDFYAENGNLAEDVVKVRELLRVTGKFSNFLPELFSPIFDAIRNIIVFIKIQPLIDSSLANLLHNIENIVIECKLVIPILPEFTQKNISMNRNLLNMQIQMLEHYTDLCGDIIPLWAYMNKELVRPQSRQTLLSVNIILIQKRRDVAQYTEQFVTDLSVLSKAITVTAQVNNKLLKGEGGIDEHLQTMTELTLSEAYKAEPLVKFLVLSRTIKCYIYKIAQNKKPFLKDDKRDLLQQDLEKLTGLLREFEQTMPAVAAMRSSTLFKFINNFIFIQNIFHEVVSSTELAYLGYELVYKHTQDPKLKNALILTQTQVLAIQCAILTCMKDTFSEEYLRAYFFKGAGVCFKEYDAQCRNQAAAKEGDLHSVIKGILIANILSYNEERVVKLETILLELMAKQVDPQVAEAYVGIAITEEELSNWGKQAEKEKRAEEEKKPALPKKERELKKRAKKAHEKDAKKRKEKEKEGRPTEVASTQLVPKKTNNPMSEQLSELLSTLDPQNFSVERINAAINKLRPMLIDSSDQELLFNTRSAIGDSYCMIANHTAKCKNGEPAVIIVNMKLGFQYYRMATFSLTKLAHITKSDDFYNYYSWLHNTVKNQWRLLTNYVQNFSTEYAKLLESQKEYHAKHPNAPDPRSNPNWKPSKYTIRRMQLRAALGEIDERLPENVKKSSAEIALHANAPMSLSPIEFQAPGIADVQEPLPQLKFHAGSEENAEVPRAPKILLTRLKSIELVDEGTKEMKVPPKPQQTQATATQPVGNGRKPNTAISSLQSLEDKFKQLAGNLEHMLQVLEAQMENEVQRRVDERMTFVFENYLKHKGILSKRKTQAEQPEEVYPKPEVVSSDEEEDGVDELPPLPSTALSSSRANCPYAVSTLPYVVPTYPYMQAATCSYAYVASTHYVPAASSPPIYATSSSFMQPAVINQATTLPHATAVFTKLMNFNAKEGPLGSVHPSMTPFPAGQYNLPMASSVPTMMQPQPAIAFPPLSAEAVEALKPHEPHPTAMNGMIRVGDVARHMRPLGATASTVPQCSTALSGNQPVSSGTTKTEVSTGGTHVALASKENDVAEKLQR